MVPIKRPGQDLCRIKPPPFLLKSLNRLPAVRLGIKDPEYRRSAAAHAGAQCPCLEQGPLHLSDGRMGGSRYRFEVIVERLGDLADVKPCNISTIAFFCQPKI